jgi:sulfonate transport system substrate-binding protein
VVRQGYGAKPITPEVVRAQQDIANTFTDLKLIPKKLAIQDVIWTAPQSVAQQAD